MQQHRTRHTGTHGARWMRLIPFLLLLLAFIGTSSLLAAQATPDARHVTFTLKYTLTSREALKWEELTIVLPQNWEGRQQILNQEYSPKDGVNVFTKDGRTYATFHIDNPRRSEDVIVTTEANIFRDDLATAEQNPPVTVKEEKDALAPFLKAEPLIEVNAAPIQAVAQQITGTSDVGNVAQIMTYVKSRLRFPGFMPNEIGALQALMTRQGDCSEYSALFVALCRAKGIPARRCTGFLVNESLQPSKIFHAWLEAYLDGYGWVPFDPAMSNSYLTATDPRVYFTNLETDPVMGGDHVGACVGMRRDGGGTTRVRIVMEVHSQYD